jgi:hypothetical protein
VTLALVGFASVLYGCMSLYFMKQNSRRLAGMEDGKMQGKTEDEIKEMGDESPKYVFTI